VAYSSQRHRQSYCSVALSVKMSVLLYLPAFLVVLVKQRGLATTIRLCLTILSVQAMLAYPFLLEHPLPYFKNAFDLGRIFLYKWTVNWRFLSEDSFLDSKFARALLVGHASVLIAFGLFRWCRTAGGPITVLNRAVRHPSRPGSPLPVTADGAHMGVFNLLRHSERLRRSHHDRFNVQPYRNSFRTFVTLPILFLVCLSSAPVGVEDKLPYRSQVCVMFVRLSSSDHSVGSSS
jgi:ALG3 protein